MILQPNTSVREIRAEIRRSRQLSRFHEVKLIQGDRVLKDNDAIEMALPQRFVLQIEVDKVNLNTAGSNFIRDWRRMIQHTSCVCVNLADVVLPAEVHVEVVVSLSLPLLIGSLLGNNHSAKEQALAVLDITADKSLDREQSERLWHATSHEHLSEFCPRRLGQLFARLCAAPAEFFSRLVSLVASGAIPGWVSPWQHTAAHRGFEFALAAFAQLHCDGAHAQLDQTQRQVLLTAVGLAVFKAMQPVLSQEEPLFDFHQYRHNFQHIQNRHLSPREELQTKECFVILLAIGDCLATWQAYITQIGQWNRPLAAQLQGILQRAMQSIPMDKDVQHSADAENAQAAVMGAHDAQGTASGGSETVHLNPHGENVHTDEVSDQHQQDHADEASDPDQIFSADTVQAIQNSRLEVPAPPLSGEGTVLLRLTRMGSSARLQEVLETSEHLEGVRSRLRDANCEMRPPFTLARTFIPLTEAMLTEANLDLDHNHIVALPEHKPLLEAALRELNCKGGKRPRVAPDTRNLERATSSTEERAPAAAEEVIDAEFEESEEVMVEMVGALSIRTDSDFGMPAPSF